MSSWDEAETARLASARVKPGRLGQLRVKRVIDVIGAVVALAAFGPLFIIIAVAIRLDGGGPVFIRQPRLGRGAEPFAIIGFRTVRSGSDRPAPIGRFLQAAGFEKLPQLFNVLKGEMSLVGPRPHAPEERAGDRTYRDIVPFYDARFCMAPGLTGWAQANGPGGSARNAQQALATIKHDLEYIENFSVAHDLRIIGMTLWREVVFGSGK